MPIYNLLTNYIFSDAIQSNTVGRKCKGRQAQLLKKYHRSVTY